MKRYEDVIEFHGHSCPGLAIGYRVSLRALKEFGSRSEDEEIVAVVENNSCAVDAVQVMTGCTFGKGNLIFNDYGKQVYTFISRRSGRGIRIAVNLKKQPESAESKKAWDKYMQGDRSSKVLKVVHDRKAAKLTFILGVSDAELLCVKKGKMQPPPEAHIFRSLVCDACGEQVMEPRARLKEGRTVCLPCFGADTK